MEKRLLHNDLARIIELFQVDDDIVAELRQKTLDITDINDATKLAKEIEQRIRAARVQVAEGHQKIEDIPYYYILLSCCHHSLNESQKAIETAKTAIEKARVCGNNWFQTIGHWFISLVYREARDNNSYREELDNAMQLARQALNEHLARGNYAKVENCREVLENIQAEHAYATNKLGTGISNIDLGNQSARPTSGSALADQLIVPWLPVYESVQAGLSGVEWVEKLGSKIGISQIAVDGQNLNIYNLRKISSSDHHIKIVPGQRAGLIKVTGHSMNACQPKPIENNDFVLFYRSDALTDGDIVIASYPAASGEFAYILKRYKGTDKTLISETNDTSQAYPPIKIGPQHKILGIVIAVAKPASS